jgi:hypothetical protein
LTVTVQNVDEGSELPVNFFLAGYRGADQDATIDATVSRSPSTFGRIVQGGRYCFYLTNLTRVPAEAGLATTTNFGQDISLWMALGS